eukprot:2055155-Pyramimonas_sp.AAC.2
MSNVAAHALGLCLGMDIHRTTVCRWEVWLRAALVASAKHFHASCRAEMALSTSGLHVQLHCLRGDATNACIWNRQKLRCAELSSYYVLGGVYPDTDWDAFKSCISHRTILGDLQVVKGGGGEYTHSIVTKQMDSVGFHDWGSCGSQFYCIEDSRDRLPLPLSDEPGEPGGPEPAVDGGAGAAAGSVDLAPFADVAAAPVDSVDVDEGVLTILVLGSDAGGDEKKSRRQ